MKRYRVRFTQEAEADLLRLYDFLLEKDVTAAGHALESIALAIDVLRFSPFTCRKAGTADPFVRELVIPFSAAGYVALFEIEPDGFVTILAIRLQREDDFL